MTTFDFPPGTVVAGGVGGEGRPGSVCPTGWTENFDRAEMSTQVLIGHATPGDVPTFRYNFPGSFTDPPAAGLITLNAPQQTATVMHVNKVDANGVDQTVWLRFVQNNSTVSITSTARTTADDNNKRRGYKVIGAPTETATSFSWPIYWTDGTEAFTPGTVDLTLQLVAEPPQLWYDPFGVDHYGQLTFNRTGLTRVDPMSNPIYQTIADRILEVRGSNSVPRLATVTIDARTDRDFPMNNMDLMSAAAPEKPSRYVACLQVDGRIIFNRMVFATAVRHRITRDEWTLEITLDLADWAGVL